MKGKKNISILMVGGSMAYNGHGFLMYGYLKNVQPGTADE